MKNLFFATILVVGIVLYCYFKSRRYKILCELAIWQTFLQAQRQNEPSLFTAENMFLKFQELSKGKYTKHDHEKEAMLSSFEKAFSFIKENNGLYLSIIRKDKMLDFSSMLK